MVLSINIVPSEDEFVLPFLEGNGYGFIGLRDSDGSVKKDYKVIGAPTNFLIDTRGRIVFQPRVHDDDTQGELELEIESLLSRASQD